MQKAARWPAPAFSLANSIKMPRRNKIPKKIEKIMVLQQGLYTWRVIVSK